jgi:hypothetical protein
MRIGYYDNAERRVSFKDILKNYDPSGYRVEVTYPLRFKGTIIKQMRVGYTASPAEFFLVKMDHPTNFTEYSHTILDDDPEKIVAVHRQLQQFGCMEGDLITCLFIQWSHMRAIDIHRGQPLEYQEPSIQSGLSGTRTTLGIAQNVFINDKNQHTIVEFFLLEPLTWFRSPHAIETDFLKPHHVSRFSVALTSDGVYRDWKDFSSETLPKGKLSEDGEEYLLTEPIELESVKPICDKLTNATDRTRCLLEASLFHVIPIDMTNSMGLFRPMRMEHAEKSIPYSITKRDLEDWWGMKGSE